MYRKFKTVISIPDTENIVKRSSESFVEKTTPEKVTTTSPDVQEKIKRCWETVENQRSQNKSESVISEVSDNIGLKVIRLFVSSTFTDFFSEREILVKKVFPELRQWCEERQMQLIECDLRWGVPKDAVMGIRDTICTCMEEIDRCHEDNEGEPFFLNMISDRYGWVPSEEEIPLDIREKYDWVPNSSITMMEIMHAAYRRDNPNACYFIRDSAYLKDIPETHTKRFLDTTELGIKQLKILKKQLREIFPDQTFDYVCKVGEMTETMGRKQVNLVDLDDFAAKVMEFFKQVIEKKYPNQKDVKILDEDDQEDRLQQTFLKQKSEFVIGREEQIKQLLAYANGDTVEDVEVREARENPVTRKADPNCSESDNNLMVVEAQMGEGKTLLLSKVVVEAQKAGLEVFYHFVGCTGRSRQSNLLMRRLLKFLIGQCDTSDEEVKIPEDIDSQTELLKKTMRSDKVQNRHIVLVIDAVNELSESNYVSHLAWLPVSFPENIYCIISSNNHPPTLSRIYEHKCYSMNLPLLTNDHSRQIVIQVLGKFNKRLDNEQMTNLMSRPGVSNPLWLSLVCEELRVYGDFGTLTKKIEKLPDTTDNLMGDILKRLIEEDETGCMEKVLIAITLSEDGLPVSEVLSLLGDWETEQPIPPVYWSHVRLLLKAYIKSQFTRTENIMFIHETVYKAVFDHILKTDQDIAKWHTYLADYYERYCKDVTLRQWNTPRHLSKANLKDRLVKFMTKDRDSARIPPFMRNKFLKECRCKSLADPVIPSNKPLYLCHMCKNKSGGFINNHQMNSNLCVVCGTTVHNVPGMSHIAHLCQRHNQLSPPAMFRCFLCNFMGKIDQPTIKPVQGKLCHWCGVGFGGKTCVKLGN